MHWLQNQCSVLALPQPRLCPRSGASPSISQQTLHGSPGMWGFTGGHPEERYTLWDNQVYFMGVRAPSCSAVWWVVRLQFSGGCCVSVCVDSRWVALAGNG